MGNGIRVTFTAITRARKDATTVHHHRTHRHVTGIGRDAMSRPHLRFTAADTVDLPPPGFLSGGPNAARQDEVSKNPGGVKYPFTEPARCWVDDERSYASNEIAINWNAPYALLLGYLDAKLR